MPAMSASPNPFAEANHGVPWEHGKGYATEAARRARRAVHDLFGWRTAVSVIHVDNAASMIPLDRDL